MPSEQMEALTKKIKVIEQKVKLMHGIGFLPDEVASQILGTCQMSFPLLTLMDAITPDDESVDVLGSESEGVKHIEEIDDFLSEGMKMLEKKLQSDECVECGKCTENLSIVETLLSGEPVSMDGKDFIKEGINEHTQTIGEA